MISGYIDSSPFSIYNCGEIMIYTPYYIQWSPSYISSGTFVIESRTFNFSSYSSGFFTSPYFSSGCIDESAFKNNSDIVSIETNARWIDADAFAGCTSLSEFTAYNCSVVNPYCFENCVNLVNVSLPLCSFVGAYTFANCYALSQISLPKCSAVYGYTFANCSSLKSAYFDEASVVNGRAFDNCHVYTVSLPKCRRINSYAFTSNCGVFYLSLPICSSIASSAFISNTAFEFISLGSNSVCKLVHSNAFQGTGFDPSERGVIYVPCSLKSAYKSASHWSYYSSRIFCFEDVVYWWYPTEGGHGGTYVGTDNYVITARPFHGVVIDPDDPFNPDIRMFITCSFSEFHGKISFMGSWGTYTSFFDRCYNIEQLYFEQLEVISRSGTFANLSNLTYVSLPVCRIIRGDGTFYGDYKLSQISLPKCEYLDTRTFAFCHSLNDVSLPKCEYLGDGMFAYCSSLSFISLPMCSYIGSAAFYDTGLQTIILTSTSVCRLVHSNAFQSTNISSIYVPSSLVETYQSASNWSYYSSYIKPIQWGIVGTFNDWGATSDLVMSRSGNYYVYRSFNYSAPQQFKIRMDNDWTINNGAVGTYDSSFPSIVSINSYVDAKSYGMNIAMTSSYICDIWYNPYNERIYVMSTGMTPFI